MCWRCGKLLVSGARSVRLVDGNPVQLHKSCAARQDSEDAEECLTARQRRDERFEE